MKTFTLVGDFNLSILGRYFARLARSGEYDVRESPYGQVIGTLAGFEPEPGRVHDALVWARPESVSLGFRRALALERVAPAECLADVGWLRTTAAPALPRLWYAAKIPFANAVFQAAAADLVRALDALDGKSRRLIVLDLDDTLWGGVVGETGWRGIRLGGHDLAGEAFKAFQEALKALTRRGVQLAVVSKNDEAVALEAVDRHPEMVLRREDFAGWRIDWRDKAGNLVELLAELNLGAASAVFIDDSPVERDRVRSALPEILVPEWPDDPCLYVRALERLGCFDTATVSDEDRSRTRMVSEERARRALPSDSMADWLRRLGTRVTVEPVNDSNVQRVEQLFNKTNQMNLSTRRLSAAEILAWADGPNRAVLACSVADKFGDLGLTGIVSVENEGGEARLVDYVLSCRVMGRKVEEALLHLAVECARGASARRLLAIYVPTARNAPTLRVLAESGLTESPEHRFSWDCASPFPKPECVAIERRLEPGREAVALPGT